ncbi:hypothetical protein ES705_45213 [subsurface metagenome]
MEISKDDKDIKIVELCQVFCDTEAVLIKSLLASYNIECILQSDLTRSVRPYIIGIYGATEISILVSDRDFEESKEIIKEVKNDKEIHLPGN